MYLPLFFLLFSSGVSSCFLSLKEMPHPQKTKETIIKEMLCLLAAEKGTVNETFHNPLQTKKASCAHFNTNAFLCELHKVHTLKCMKTFEKDMRSLKEKCSILQKSSSDDSSCELVKTNFTQFKKSLKEFLQWVYQKQDCRNIVRSESGLYLDGICSCPDSWKYRKGLL